MTAKSALTKTSPEIHIMAVDCCEHILAKINDVLAARITSYDSRRHPPIGTGTHNAKIELIVIGVPRYPVRRLFISQLRRLYPNTPMLILRREPSAAEDSAEGSAFGEVVRGEFLLSDTGEASDCDFVQALRRVLPLEVCPHTHKGANYNRVREVVRVIAENYADPQLDLTRVARKLPTSPTNLSRFLNKTSASAFANCYALRASKKPNACSRRVVTASRKSPRASALPIVTIFHAASKNSPPHLFHPAFLSAFLTKRFVVASRRRTSRRRTSRATYIFLHTDSASRFIRHLSTACKSRSASSPLCCGVRARDIRPSCRRSVAATSTSAHGSFLSENKR